MSTRTSNPITSALSDAVSAYLRLHYGHVIVPELYEVFRFWHPSVTPSLLNEIIRGTLSDNSNEDSPPLPAWDPAAGQLYFAKYLVKEFRRRSQKTRSQHRPRSLRMESLEDRRLLAVATLNPVQDNSLIAYSAS